MSGLGDPQARVALVRARAAVGLPVAAADVPGRAVHRRAVALAIELGASLAPVLAVVDEVARADQELATAVRRASAEGRAVAVGLVVAPPVLGIVGARVASDEPLAWIDGAVGRGLVAVALGLWVVGSLAVVAAVRRAGRPPPLDDELYVLAGVAVRAGEPLAEALRHAGRVAGDGRPSSHRTGAVRDARRVGERDPGALALWLELGGRGPPPGAWGATGEVLATAVADGIALAPLLDELARRARAHGRDAALERAGRLGAQLSVPTALLLLPAGLLLAAGPLLLAALDALT